MTTMAANETKQSTPTGSDVKHTTEKSAFTEKEERVLKVAWLCLKSGPPEVDIAKLVELGGFNTAKTAANTWGVIKKKLMTLAPPVAEGEESGTFISFTYLVCDASFVDRCPVAIATPVKTPAKAKTTPKKKKAASDDGEEANENGESPKKKRKTSAKKTPTKKEVKAKEDAEESSGEAAAAAAAAVKGEAMEE